MRWFIRAISSESTLFAMLFLFVDRYPVCTEEHAKMSRWKSTQKLGDERVTYMNSFIAFLYGSAFTRMSSSGE